MEQSKEKGKVRRSFTWQHFKLVEFTIRNSQIQYAHCNYCNTKYKFSEDDKGESTGNLIIHLKNIHKIERKSFDDVEEEFVFSQNKYRAALLEWIIECSQPFTEPQQKSFLNVVRSLNPSAKTVSSTTLKRDLMEKYNVKAKALKIILDKAKGMFSFSIDCWTSKNVLPFMNIRVHWINDNWMQESAMLDFCHLQGKHSGLKLSNVFTKSLIRFGIPLTKVLGITLDNAKNNDTFFASLEKYAIKYGVIISSVEDQVRCLAHILNLSVQNILKSLKLEGNELDEENELEDELDEENEFNEEEFEYGDELDEDEEDELHEENEQGMEEDGLDDNDTEGVESETESDVEDQECSEENEEVKRKKSKPTILTKLRKLVKKIRKSTQMREAFKNMCSSLGVQHKVLIIDVPIRWNSTYKMIQRAYEYKEPLRTLCQKTKSLTSYLISEREWKYLSTINTLLKKFDRATQYISMARHPTISAYLPKLNWLKDSLDSFVQRNSGSLAKAVAAGLSKLKKYEMYVTNSKIPFIATFLNPMLKMNYFKELGYSKDSIKEIEKAIHNTFKEKYEVREYTSVGKFDENEDEIMGHMYKKTKIGKLANEFQKYLRFPLSPPTKNFDILEYWKLQKSEFPCLSEMARDYLGVQSTSVSVERDFSDGADIVTPTRGSLKADTIRALMCTKSWLKNKI